MIKLETKKLASVLDINAKCVGSKVMPILDNVIFEISNGKCYITTSEMSAEVTTFLKVDEDIECTFCIDAKTLFNTVKLVDDEELFITLKDNNVMIKAGRSKYKIPSMPVKGFPRIREGSDIQYNVFPRDMIKSITKTTSFINPNESRTALTGVSLNYKEGKATIQATDSFVFYHKTFDVDKEFSDCVVSFNVTSLIDSFKDSTDLNFGIDSKVVVFKDSATTIKISLINSKFPETKFLLENIPTRNVVLNRNEFIKSIKRAIVYSNIATKHIVFKFLSEDKSIKILSEDVDYRKASNEIVTPIAFNMEEDETIGFNSLFILKCLNSLEGENVKIYVGKASGISYIVDSEELDDEITFVTPFVIQS